MKTALKILSLIAVAGWLMPLTSQAAIISADGQLPTFYVYADVDVDTTANQTTPPDSWKFEPVIENTAAVAVRVLTPELKVEQVKTPGVSMTLTQQNTTQQ